MLSLRSFFKKLAFRVPTTQETILGNLLKTDKTGTISKDDIQLLNRIKTEYVSGYDTILDPFNEKKIGFISLKTYDMCVKEGKYPIAIIKEVEDSYIFVFLKPVRISAKYFPGLGPNEIYHAPKYSIEIVDTV